MRQLLKELYGLEVESFREIMYGFREKSFETVLSDGSKVFVKEIVHEKRKNERQNYMRKGLSLSQSYSKAPKVIKTIDGDYVGNKNNRCFIVTEWVDGNTYEVGELTVKRAHSLGQALAEFHKGIDYETSKTVMDYTFDQVASDYYRHYQSYRHEPSEYGAIARAFLAMQKQIISRPVSRIEYRRSGKAFGSFWIEQAMYDNDDNVIALVDWTDIAIGEADQLNDIVIGAHLSGMNKEQLIAYLSGYHQNYPLTSGELESVIWRISHEALYYQWYLGAWLSNKETMDPRWEKACKRWTLTAMEYYYLYDELINTFL